MASAHTQMAISSKEAGSNARNVEEGSKCHDSKVECRQCELVY